jgi:two-component system response regulator (stage 0 sporulation protein F)
MDMTQFLINSCKSEVGLKRILIVDDETGFLLALKKILQGPKVAVDTAETVETATALLSERKYDAVITDIMLTTILGQEGFEILRYVKDHNPGTKVIILTAYGNSNVLEKAIHNGADLFFEKPVSSQVLMNALSCWGIQCEA